MANLIYPLRTNRWMSKIPLFDALPRFHGLPEIILGITSGIVLHLAIFLVPISDPVNTASENRELGGVTSSGAFLLRILFNFDPDSG